MYIPGGLIDGALIGWVIWWLFSTIEEWFSDRREFKEIDRQNEEFKKTHHFDDRHQRRVRTVDGAGRLGGSTVIAPLAFHQNEANIGIGIARQNVTKRGLDCG